MSQENESQTDNEPEVTPSADAIAQAPDVLASDQSMNQRFDAISKSMAMQNEVEQQERSKRQALRQEHPDVRDFFAAHALSTTCAALSPDERAAQCYVIADAMLKARGTIHLIPGI